MFIKLAQLSRFWTNAKNYIANGYVAKVTGKGTVYKRFDSHTENKL